MIWWSLRDQENPVKRTERWKRTTPLMKAGVGRNYFPRQPRVPYLWLPVRYSFAHRRCNLPQLKVKYTFIHSSVENSSRIRQCNLLGWLWAAVIATRMRWLKEVLQVSNALFKHFRAVNACVSLNYRLLAIWFSYRQASTVNCEFTLLITVPRE